MRYCKVSSLRLVFILMSITSPYASAEYSFETEWDVYYSNIGYYQSFTNEPIPEVVEDDESSTYSRMFDSILARPRFMLIELGVYPLPFAAAYVKEHHLSTYDNISVGDFNILQAFTAGYDEPYALSLFFGSIVRFVSPGEKKKVKNRGYTGFLFSFGDQHIVKNLMVDDKWYELEWKIKGDKDFENKTLSWSFRIGAKVHENIEITDVVYFGLRRNHLDILSDEVSWFQNADIDYKIDFDSETFELSQQSLFINKKWPTFLFGKSTFEFGVGFIHERNKYTASLESQQEDFQLILRPSFRF